MDKFARSIPAGSRAPLHDRPSPPLAVSSSSTTPSSNPFKPLDPDAHSVVSDPSDWLGSQVPELKDVDQAMRCYICKDFARAPMMTACCSRTFCSLCIRRQFTADARCPMCLKAGSESQLRKNRELEMAIEAFTGLRQKLVEILKPRKEEPEPVQLADQVAQPSTTINGTAKTAEQGKNTEKSRNSSSSSSSSKSSKGEMAACPICSELFSVTDIETFHLAECLNKPPPRRHAAARSLQTTASLASSSTQYRDLPQPTYALQSSASASPSTPPKKLPKPGTTNLKLKDLKARLAKLGLATTGTHSELVRRESEWINIWNANCDALRPRSMKELGRELRLWEEQQLHLPPPNQQQGTQLGAPAQAQPGKKSFEDARAYSKQQNETFKALARKARQAASGGGSSSGKKKQKKRKHVDSDSSTSASDDQQQDLPDDILESDQAQFEHSQKRHKKHSMAKAQDGAATPATGPESGPEQGQMAEVS